MLQGVAGAGPFVASEPEVRLVDSTTAQTIAVADVADNGDFVINNVAPGVYQLRADSLRHVSATLSGLTVDGSDVVVPAVTLRGGDADGDDAVAGGDISAVVATFGLADPNCSTGDINCDGFVSGADISLVVGNFGTVGPAPWE